MIHSCFNNCDKVSIKFRNPCKAGLVNTNYQCRNYFPWRPWRILFWFLLYFIGIYKIYINIIILYFNVFIKILSYFLNNRVLKPSFKKKIWNAPFTLLRPCRQPLVTALQITITIHYLKWICCICLILKYAS